MSDFKLDINSGVLSEWLEPVLTLLRIIFSELETVFSTTDHKEGEFLQCPELCLTLVSGLVTRLPDKSWLSALHHHCSLQLLISAAGACTRHSAGGQCHVLTVSNDHILAPSFVNSIFSLLIEVSGCAAGSSAVLLQDLARDVWLPLSDHQQSSDTAAWSAVRHAALQLAATLVRVARRHAVQTAVTAVALLQERIVSDLLSPRQGLQHLSSAAAVSRLVWTLSEYVTAWQTDHCSSLHAGIN